MLTKNNFLDLNVVHDFLSSSWAESLKNEFQLDYMLALKQFLREELQREKTIYPPLDKVFSALNYVPLDDVKVVILGQDPYHGVGQANGLSFSVSEKSVLPPSLKNIYKELERDLQINKFASGDLSSWAKQGVLLLNSVLTVEANKAGSHAGQGWEIFTDKIINLVNEKRQKVVFMLWGTYAQKKGKIIDAGKHFVLRSVHPSPLSAYRGFIGCDHFSQTNHYLLKQGKADINW